MAGNNNTANKNNQNSNLGTILGVIAIVLAGAALIFAFMAYNRTSEENLESMVGEQVEQTLQQLLQPQPAPNQQQEPAPGNGIGE